MYVSKSISAGTRNSDNSRTLVLSHLSRTDFNVFPTRDLYKGFDDK